MSSGVGGIAWGVKKQQRAFGVAFCGNRIVRRKGKLAFAAVLSDGEAPGEAAFLYAGVLYGVLEFGENCGMYFVWTDVCGNSRGVGVCEVFFSRAGRAVYDVCNFDADAVQRYDAAVVSGVKWNEADGYAYGDYSSGGVFDVSRFFDVPEFLFDSIRIV